MRDFLGVSFWQVLPGLAVAVLIAGGATILALGHVVLDPLVLSMIISIIAGNLLGPSQRLKAGVSLSYRLFIPLGIILYGSQLDLRPLRTVSTWHVAHTYLIVFAALAAVTWLALRLGLTKKLALLLAAGSAVCGASAIMVLSPVVGARKEETSVSLIAITVMGLAGVIVYPLAQEFLNLGERTYALFCGSTLYQVGQVKAAAALMSTRALELALPVKLLRVGALFPIAILFSLVAGEPGKKLFVPWFILASMVVAAAFNLFPSLAALRGDLSPLVGFFFSIAIAGIGLTADLESIIDIGAKPFVAVALGWVILVVLFAAGILLIGV